jgi:transposase
MDTVAKLRRERKGVEWVRDGVNSPMSSSESSGRPILQIASELGLSPSMLRNWRNRGDGQNAGSALRLAVAGLPVVVVNRRQIAALVGLAPWARQSGQWRGKSFIGGGRKHVRSSVFVGAMVAARYNPQLKQFCDKRVAAGKPKLLALIAVARKLLTILNAILRDRRPWQPLPT